VNSVLFGTRTFDMGAGEREVPFQLGKRSQRRRGEARNKGTVTNTVFRPPGIVAVLRCPLA